MSAIPALAGTGLSIDSSTKSLGPMCAGTMRGGPALYRPCTGPLPACYRPVTGVFGPRDPATFTRVLPMSRPAPADALLNLDQRQGAEIRVGLRGDAQALQLSASNGSDRRLTPTG